MRGLPAISNQLRNLLTLGLFGAWTAAIGVIAGAQFIAEPGRTEYVTVVERIEVPVPMPTPTPVTGIPEAPVQVSPVPEITESSPDVAEEILLPVAPEPTSAPPVPIPVPTPPPSAPTPAPCLTHGKEGNTGMHLGEVKSCKRR